MNFVKVQTEKGFATLIALMAMIMLTMLGLAALYVSDDEVSIAGNELQEMRAFMAAEAGLEKAAAELQFIYDSTGAPPKSFPKGIDSMNNCIIWYTTVDNGPAQQRNLTTGSLTGMHALVKSFSINSTAVSSMEGAKVVISESFETAMVPIFQWAVFFDQDLWAQPLFDMTIDGRVHVNKDMHLQNSGAGNALTFLNGVTCAGDIFAGFPYNNSQNGDVLFTDASGNQVSMQQGGTWIDADYSDWYDSASSLWQGRVQDKTFGQEPLDLSLGSSGDPHKMIERASGNPDSYENKASFKIIDGVPYSVVGGVWQDVTIFLPASTIMDGASTEFYDQHEKKTVRNTQIDIAKLQKSGYFPKNGILYISDQRSSGSYLNAASLINGSDVGYPLTIASENPLYVHGDFNTVKKQPVATISDAITFLSNNWNPAFSSGDLSDRKASKTTINLSFVTGDLEPVNGNYGGGLENLARFLEDWNGEEITLRGSTIELWRSQQATGTWRYGGSDAYYTAPTRNWGYDTDLDDPNKLPPGTPMIRVFQRVGWTQEYVSLGQASDTL